MTTDRDVDSWLLETTRHQRSDLHIAAVRLEEALAAPAPGRLREWAAGVHDRMTEVSAALERHIVMTESADGLFDAVRRANPRLAKAVARLCVEHTELRNAIADGFAAVDALARSDDPAGAAGVRKQASDLLTELSGHRQRGADLVYEAYAVDIGGGD